MQVVALGLPFMFGFFVFISLMRGAGDTITPMLVMFGTVVINVILDPFLINGWSVGPLAFPELGIRGRLSPLSSPGAGDARRPLHHAVGNARDPDQSRRYET